MYSLPLKRSFALLILVVDVGTARADERVFDQTLPSSVWVLVPAEDQIGNGTGFVVDSRRRLVLTCKHVVKDRAQAVVFFPLYEDNRLVTDAAEYLRRKTGIRGRVLAV